MSEERGNLWRIRAPEVQQRLDDTAKASRLAHEVFSGLTNLLTLLPSDHETYGHIRGIYPMVELIQSQLDNEHFSAIEAYHVEPVVNVGETANAERNEAGISKHTGRVHYPPEKPT